MTKEQFQAVLSIIDEYSKQCDWIEEEAKKNGTWQMGLDSNKDLFKKAQKEAMEKLEKFKKAASKTDKE